MCARQCACTRFWKRAHIMPLLRATQIINRPIRVCTHPPPRVRTGEQTLAVNTDNSCSRVFQRTHSVIKTFLGHRAIFDSWGIETCVKVLSRTQHYICSIVMEMGDFPSKVTKCRFEVLEKDGEDHSIGKYTQPPSHVRECTGIIYGHEIGLVWRIVFAKNSLYKY